MCVYVLHTFVGALLQLLEVERLLHNVEYLLVQLLIGQRVSFWIDCVSHPSLVSLRVVFGVSVCCC